MNASMIANIVIVFCIVLFVIFGPLIFHALVTKDKKGLSFYFESIANVFRAIALVCIFLFVGWILWNTLGVTLDGNLSMPSMLR